MIAALSPADAKPLPEHTRPRLAHPPAGFGGSAVAGWADDGWIGRIEYELFPVMAPNRTIGPFLGFVTGMEYWRDGEDKGFSLPVLWAGGVRIFPVRAMLGVGIHALTIDKVAGDWGGGAWGPIAMGSLGFDIFGVRVGVDLRAARHVNLGADDFTQLQLGISVGYTWSTAPSGTPYY